MTKLIEQAEAADAKLLFEQIEAQSAALRDTNIGDIIDRQPSYLNSGAWQDMINRKKKSNDPMGGAFTSRHSGFNQINLSSTLQTKSPSSKLKGIKA